MTALPPDNELVSAYATEASESAFQALVRRHVDLVYATALRQAGDPGLAEEITQNVFIALARKAPRLAGMETLAGWLHRTAILEAKARIRSELRRRRREEKAMEAADLEREGSSPFAALLPLLDEALLHLREGDRLALVMRFLEDRSLRDVGEAMGLGEDAARKRVSRALDRLTSFFRARGLAVPAGAGAATLLTNATQAAPAALAASAAHAGMAAGGAASGFNLLYFHLMTLTKTQTAAICLVLVAAPLAWQHKATATVLRQQKVLATQLENDRQKAADLEAQTSRKRSEVVRAQAEAMNAEIRLKTLTGKMAAPQPPPVYQWDDNARLLRVPKAFVDRIPVAAVNRRGRVSETMVELLQLNQVEAQTVQADIDRFLDGYRSAQEKNLQAVEPTEKDLNGREPEEVRVFKAEPIGEAFGQLRQTLFEELQAAMGAERFQTFLRGLDEWMPVDDAYHGLNSAMTIYNTEHTDRFYKPKPGDRTMQWSVSATNGMMSLGLFVDDIPELYRSRLQDWIDLAHSQPPPEAQAQP